jgi:hypothetical protein
VSFALIFSGHQTSIRIKGLLPFDRRTVYQTDERGRVTTVNMFRQTLRITAILTALALGSACTSSHQVFKYENPIRSISNLVPGVEPGESDNKITISVFGEGFDPENGNVHQKKYLAERAATIDGYRKLSERLSGILVTAYTKSGMTGITEDQVTSETNAYLRGAQARLISYKNGVAIVNTKIFIEPRQVKAYHGTKLSRAILTALAGATVGVAAGTLGGLAVGATAAEIEAAAAIGAAAGAAGGAAYSAH